MTIVNILGESAVRSLALALAVAILLRVLRVQHARLAKRAWTAVLVLALAMPALVAMHVPSVSFTALWSLPRTVIAPAVQAATPVALANSPIALSAATIAPAQSEIAAPAITLHVPVPAALQGAPAPMHHIAIWQYGFAAYLVITALLLLRVLLGLVLAARLWSRAQAFATSETELPVRLSIDLRSPATVGHGILLPLEAIEWDEAALRATLAHEEQHVREGDFYLQLAATIHFAFFWISPHAWWLRPQLSRLSETICDRAAVTSSGDGLSYAQLLIRFASAEQMPAGMVAMAQSAGLRERVERLIADPQLSGAFRQRRGQALCAAALLAATAVVAVATVRIVQPESIVLAAPQAPPAAPAPSASPAPVAPQAEPAPASGVASPAEVAPVAPTPEAAPAAPAPAVSVAPVPPVPPDAGVAVSVSPDEAPVPQSESSITINDGSRQPYAILNMDGNGSSVMHGSNREAWKALLHQKPGGAIWFERDGKSYIIDDPALVKQARDAYAPVENLGKRQGELGDKQGELGEQQGDLGALQGQLGAKQGEWGAQQAKFAQDFHFEMPKDFDKTVNEFAQNETKLAFNHESMTDAQRAEWDARRKELKERMDKAMEQFKANQPQREAMEKQMREQSEQMRVQMEPLMKQMSELAAKQSELGRRQSELGRQQSELGRQQHEASREAERQVQSLIDQAVRDGKAHPAN